MPTKGDKKMEKRTDLYWGGGHQSVIMDIEHLPDIHKDREVYFYDYEQDTEAVHSKYGGKNYYRSSTGYTGRGHAYLPSFAFPVSTYRVDTRNKYINRVSPIELAPDLFMHVYYPTASHASVENPVVYVVLQKGHTQDFGTPYLKQAFFQAVDREKGYNVSDLLHAILTLAQAYVSGETQFEEFVSTIAQKSGLNHQKFHQRWIADETKETWIVEEISYPVYRHDDYIPRQDILHFLDTRFMQVKKKEYLSSLHERFSVYGFWKEEVHGKKYVYGVFSRDRRLLVGYEEDPVKNGFSETPIMVFARDNSRYPWPTDQIISHWNRDVISFSDVHVLFQRRNEKICCVAYFPVQKSDRELIPDLAENHYWEGSYTETIFWEYEEEVPEIMYGFDQQVIADRLRKKVLAKRRKSVLAEIRKRRLTK